jgi:hypothetical protein
MSYDQGTDEFRMGEQNIYPGWEVPPDFNWAAHKAGVDAASAARAARAADNGWPTSSGGGVPFVLGVPSMASDGDSNLGGAILLLLVVIVVVEFLAVILLCAVAVGLIYLLWQIPDERYEAAWDWLAARMGRGIGWTQRRAQELHAKASAAHRRFAKWHRRFTAQRRGRPLPAVERIRRR